MTDAKTPPPQPHTAADIRKLSLREHVRLRPGMYIGGTDEQALHELMFQVLEGAITQVVVGNADTVSLTLLKDDMVSINDNGIGVPIKWIEIEKMSMLEAVLTQSLIGRLEPSLFDVRSTETGAGIIAVNALSSLLIADVRRDGFLWRQTYREGIRTSEVEQIRPLEPGESTGTKITFQPDFTILQPNHFNYERIEQRLRELGYLLPGVTFRLCDERSDGTTKTLTLLSENGLTDYVEMFTSAQAGLHEIRQIDQTVEVQKGGKPAYTCRVQVAFQFRRTDNGSLLSYVNTFETSEHGTHVDGLLAALTNVLNETTTFFHDPISVEQVKKRLVASIQIFHPWPHYVSNMRNRLANSEVSQIVYDAVANAFSTYLYQHPDAARRILDLMSS